MNAKKRTDQDGRVPTLRERRYGLVNAQPVQPDITNDDSGFPDANDAAPADDSGFPDESARRRATKGSYKLTAEQRQRLIATIALHWDSQVVLQVLAEDDPDFPEIDDSLVRYYRSRMNPRIVATMQDAVRDALRTGLAVKGARVATLQRQVFRLLSIQAESDNAARRDKQPRAVMVELVRTMATLLHQIGEEMGDLGGKLPARLAESDLEADMDDDESAELDEILDALMAERQDMARAEAGLPGRAEPA